MIKHKIFVNGILEFVTESPCAAADTVGHYIDSFCKSGFTMVYRGSITDTDIYYVFYNESTRVSGAIGYVIE